MVVAPISDQEEGMTEETVKALVLDAMKAIDLDQETVKSIKEALNQKSDMKELRSILESKMGGIDTEDMINKIKEIIPTPQKGITTEELDEKLEAFASNIRKESKYEHPVIQFPIAHRAGNLTVAQKQLLNICLMNAPEEALAQGGTKRPRHMNEGITDSQLQEASRISERHVRSIREAVLYRGKALTSTGTGSGKELVNVDLSGDLQSRLYLESALASEMIGSEITMPSSPFKLPIATTLPVFKTVTQGNAGTESSPGTGEIVLTDKKLIGQTDYSYEADEDSILAILPMLQENLGKGAAISLESALINGDVSTTHQDSDIHAVSGHAAKLFTGLRRYAIAASLTSSLASGGISFTNLKAMRKLMGKYGVRASDCFILCGVMGYSELVGLAETLTADKVGTESARILTGEAPSLMGMKILVSEEVREDLNASGVYDGSTTTKGSIYIVHKPSFLMGVRRGFTVEVDVNKKTQVNSIIASFRRAFQPKETPSATVQSVIMGYNYNS